MLCRLLIFMQGRCPRTPTKGSAFGIRRLLKKSDKTFRENLLSQILDRGDNVVRKKLQDDREKS